VPPPQRHLEARRHCLFPSRRCACSHPSEGRCKWFRGGWQRERRPAAHGLSILDATTGVGAGVDGDCIGLVVASWTNSKIVLTFGNEYADYAPVATGDSIQVTVEAVTFSGTAKVGQLAIQTRPM